MKMWYNKYRKEQGKVLKTRKGIDMKFEDWVKKQNDEFFSRVEQHFTNKRLIFAYANGIAKGTQSNVCAGAISDCSYRISIYHEKNKVVMQIISMKKEKRGIAICHENDEFDPAIGIAYAWARYKKEPIPLFTTEKTLSEMQNGDIFFYDGKEYSFIGEYPVGSEVARQYIAYDTEKDKIKYFWENKTYPLQYAMFE